MAENLFASNGCVYRAKEGDSPYWEVNPSIGGSGDPIFISEVRASGNDHIGKLICFNNKRIANIVSQNFGTITIRGIALLGGAENLKQFESRIQSFVRENRASKKGESPLELSSKGGGSYKFLLEDYSIGSVEPIYNILHFELSGVLLD